MPRYSERLISIRYGGWWWGQWWWCWWWFISGLNIKQNNKSTCVRGRHGRSLTDIVMGSSRGDWKSPADYFSAFL